MDIIVHEALMGAVNEDIFKGIENVHLIEKDIVSFKLDDRLHELDTTIPTDTFILIFCSVNIAQRITRNYKNLARGLIFDPRVLSWNVYSSLIPDEYLLNNRAMAIPFGKL